MSVRHWFRWLKKSDPKDKEKRSQHDDKGVNGIWRTKSLRPPDTAGLSPSADQSSKVTITDAHLTNIPEEVFQQVNLRALILSGNQLRSLPPSIATFRLLEELVLDRNEICDLPETLKFLARLRHLELSLNPLNSVSFDTISQLRNLSVLCLNCCAVKSIPNGALPHSLKWLELRENRLKSLPNDFGRLIKLEHLDLDRNNLQSLPDSVGLLKLLVNFSCAWNELTSLPETFGSLVSLERVDLSSNFLHRLPNSCQYLERLEDLRLSSNQFQRFPVALSRCLNIRVLHINFNRITEIPDDLQKLNKLTEIQAMANAIKSLAGSSSQFSFPQLQALLCDYNQLTSLPLIRCPNLRLLSLRENSLQSLGNSLNELSNLVMLDLRNNPLRTLSIGLASIADNAAALWLGDNQVRSKPPLSANADGTALMCIYLPEKHQVEQKRTNDGPEMAQWSLAADFIYKSDLAHGQRTKARMQTGERRTPTAESAVLILPSTIAPRTRPTIRPYAMVDINTLRAQLSTTNLPLQQTPHYERISNGSTLTNQPRPTDDRRHYESLL